MRRRTIDPRLYQIGILSGLLAYGELALGFGIGVERLALTLSATLGVQWVLAGIYRLPAFDPRSALISGLSLTLLLRTPSPALVLLAALLTIGSKFVIRYDGKHVFNPTNFGLAAVLLLGPRAWVSPGQWGSAAFLGFLLACLGGLVVNRATRSDVTYAFLGFWLAIVFSRALWLGDPPAIPLHNVQSGSLLIFAFFMISDPKTTPDTRTGRILFALLVALGAGWVQFVGFRENGLIWSLVALSITTPLIDRLLPGSRYTWPAFSLSRPKGVIHMRRILPLLLVAALATAALPAAAFCGFYVAKADAEMFNRASQVALVRHDGKTVITMANDYQGDPTEFAIVIPVPTTITREQVQVTDRAILEHLDAYSAPRLVEYFDGDPCVLREHAAFESIGNVAEDAERDARQQRARSLGVTIEAEYTVGEYDIVLLSAEQSGGLLTFLTETGYRLPRGATRILGSYIRQGMRFFLARVNLDEQSRLGFSYLRPLQVAFESPKFMLPIRLGTLNADGPQDLIVYALTRNGRVETTNYRTVRLPTGMEVPLFVKDEFAEFYRAMFQRQVDRENMRVVFLEYAWNMSWCDPCAADPLSRDELRELGVFWLDRDGRGAMRGGPQGVFVTRLHVRYDAQTFPDDLRFQETGDTSNFQGRYVLRHPWKGDTDCPAARRYRAELRRRQERDAQTLARLTGRDVNEIRRKMRENGGWVGGVREPWWKRLLD